MLASAKAYAKINLYLSVKGKRSDGYHELDTVMQSISLYDEVSIELTEGEIAVTCDRGELAGEDNIAYKACRDFIASADIKIGARIHINKNIPVAAGLGGGSADAAAVLLLLNRMTGKPLSETKLSNIAAGLGADVPFFLVGGTAVAKGLGEIITPINTPTLHYVLVKECKKQSTGKMYALLDTLNSPAKTECADIVEAIKQEDVSSIAKGVYNSFEACWDMNNMLSPFKGYNFNAAFLSGSGPTVCALFADKSSAEGCAEELRGKGYNAFYAQSMPFGLEI